MRPDACVGSTLQPPAPGAPIPLTSIPPTCVGPRLQPPSPKPHDPSAEAKLADDMEHRASTMLSGYQHPLHRASGGDEYLTTDQLGGWLRRGGDGTRTRTRRGHLAAMHCLGCQSLLVVW